VSKREKERETANLEKERDEWIRKSERERQRDMNNFVFGGLIFLTLNKLGLK
jgi:hypothetical protein